MAISVAQARLICTKAELEIVIPSTTKEIGALDAKQLQALIRRARTARDKWRDLKADQTRDTKVSDPARLETANARSAEKAQLFDEVLGRFEKRLSKLEPGKSPAAPAAAKATKTVRAASHRQTRSQVRGELIAKTETLNAKSKPAATAPAVTKAAPAAPATTAAPAVKKAAKPAAKSKPVSKKATSKKPPKRKAVPKPQLPPPATSIPPAEGLAAASIAAGHPLAGQTPVTQGEKKRNLKATTAAKASRISRSGSPQILGHVAAQGRRNQAKRSGGR